MPEYTLSVLLWQEDNLWLAQCLQYDIAAQAKTLGDLRYELERILVGHLVISAENGAEPFEDIPPAPTEFWQKYLKANMRLQADTMPFRMPHPPQRPLPKPDFRIAA